MNIIFVLLLTTHVVIPVINSRTLASL